VAKVVVKGERRGEEKIKSAQGRAITGKAYVCGIHVPRALRPIESVAMVDNALVKSYDYNIGTRSYGSFFAPKDRKFEDCDMTAYVPCIIAACMKDE
jgi:hypothetical protein